MPTYEYRCTDCGHEFDIVQSFTDDALTVCPECGGKLRKVYGNVGISFKGSGFYVTDSAGAKHAASGSSNGGASGSGNDSPSSSGDPGSSSSSDSSSGAGATTTNTASD